MDESGRWVPGLDLLAEDYLEVGGVLLLDDGGDIVVEGVELFLAEGTDIVEDWFSISSRIYNQST